MFKYLLLLSLAFPVHAYQTKQEIVDYCTKMWLQDAGNSTVLICIERELASRDKIIEIAKS